MFELVARKPRFWTQSGAFLRLRFAQHTATLRLMKLANVRNLLARLKPRPVYRLKDALLALLPDQNAHYVFLDIGANHGQSAADLSNLFPNARIICFEPIERLAQEIEVRFHDNPNIEVERAAVGAAPGVQEFNLTSFDQAGSFLRLGGSYQKIGITHTGTVSVAVESVDEYCARRGIDRIHFAKIDTQGYSREVLQGAQRLLRDGSIDVLKVEYLLGDYYDRKDSFFEIEALIHPFGYRLYTFVETDTDIVGSGCVEGKSGALAYVDAIYRLVR